MLGLVTLDHDLIPLTAGILHRGQLRQSLITMRLCCNCLLVSLLDIILCPGQFISEGPQMTLDCSKMASDITSGHQILLITGLFDLAVHRALK